MDKETLRTIEHCMGISALVAIFCAMMFVVGCGQSFAHLEPTDTRDALAHIQYVKDTHTGICFATLSSFTYGGHQVVSIAAVPSEACGR